MISTLMSCHGFRFDNVVAILDLTRNMRSLKKKIIFCVLKGFGYPRSHLEILLDQLWLDA